ncbi:MAG: hypothetical protein JSW08_02405 [archaeon]|nr:MAG: hypothetical protein JSW08_02405 [archaeon]
MKHNVKVTVIILVMFLISMFIGLAVIGSYDNFFGKSAQEAAKEKNVSVEKPELSFVVETVPEPIEFKRTIDVVSVIVSILIAIAIAVGLFFLLTRLRINVVLKGWFTVIVFICLVIALTMILYSVMGGPKSLFTLFGRTVALGEVIAIPLAAFLTYFKIKKRDMIAHNLSELLIYPGIAVIFVPILNVLAAAILLILISVYDMIAVWKTKHMQALAKYQITHLKIFSGFFLPYAGKKEKAKIKRIRSKAKAMKSKKKREIFLKKQKVNLNVAALGGGDVAFPLIFIGTILITHGFLPALTVVLTTLLALGLLLFFAKKGKFYPAMPFLSAGCFLGLLLILI